MGYSFRLAARILLYASSHRQDNTYHSLCYTSHGALAGTRKYGEIDRERERKKERERKRQRQTDKQRDRQIVRHR